MLTDIAQTVAEREERSITQSYGDVGEGRLFYAPPRLDNLVVRQRAFCLLVGVAVRVGIIRGFSDFGLLGTIIHHLCRTCRLIVLVFLVFIFVDSLRRLIDEQIAMQVDEVVGSSGGGEKYSRDVLGCLVVGCFYLLAHPLEIIFLRQLCTATEYDV